MKKVLAIYVKGDKHQDWIFHQYLKLSESRFVSQLCQDFKEVVVKLETLNDVHYKVNFGCYKK